MEAVEPDARMLAVLRRNVPAARPHRSDSTSIPVGDGSLDAVLVADAWHWFEPEKTITEVRRVLKTGGWLGLVWNVAADPVADWEIELAGNLGNLSERYDRDAKSSDAGLRARLWYFGEEELQINRFLWTREMTPEARAAHWATTSTAIAMTPQEREERIKAEQDEFQRLCDKAGRASMPVRSVACCIRWTPEPQV